MGKDRRDPYRGAPPGLTEEERREWWERQRRKWVWEEGDIVITRPSDGKKPREGADGERDDEQPGDVGTR